MGFMGVAGNNASEMAYEFTRLCQKGCVPTEGAELVKLNKICANDKMIIACMHENFRPIPLRLLWVQEESAWLPEWVALLGSSDYVVANADRKEIFSMLASAKCGARLVTYGFNSRACVTASSVMDHDMQVCVQRSFWNINGQTCERKELKLPYRDGTNASTVLGAATACLVSGGAL